MIIDKSFTVTLSKEEIDGAIISYVKSKLTLNNVQDIRVRFNLKKDSTLSDDENIKNVMIDIVENEIPKGQVKR